MNILSQSQLDTANIPIEKLMNEFSLFDTCRPEGNKYVFIM